MRSLNQIQSLISVGVASSSFTSGCNRILFGLLLVFALPLVLHAQTDPDTEPEPPKAPLYLEFVKPKKNHRTDSLYFNVVKVVNNTNSAVRGNAIFLVPDDWKMLSPKRTPIVVPAGSIQYVPVRIKLPRSMKGGLTYLLTAGLDRDNEKRVLANAYINVPKVSRWGASSNDKTIYFNSREPESEYTVNLQNRGNSDEMIRLDLEVGSRLLVNGPNNGSNVAFVEVPPNTDTSIVFRVSEIPVKNEADFTDTWTAYTLRVNASTEDRSNKSFHVWFRSLESRFTNELTDQRSPLTINMMAQNVLSDFQPTINLQAFGTVLLKDRREVNYSVMHPNVARFDRTNSPFSYSEHLWRLSRMQVTYAQPGARITLGDMSDGMDQIIAGRGIKTHFQYDKHEIRATVSRNPIQPIDGANFTYGYRFHRAFSLRGGLTYQDDNYNQINTGTAALEASFLIFKRHHIRVLGSVSQRDHVFDNQTFPLTDSTFTQTDDPDTSFSGYGYRLNYSTNMGPLSIRSNSRFGSQYHGGLYNGRFESNTQALYTLNPRNRLLLRFIRNDFEPLFYRLGRLQPTTTRRTDLLDLQGIRTISQGVTLAIGPQLEWLGSGQYDFLRDTITSLGTFSPRGLARLNINYGRFNSITPQLLAGYTFITNFDDDLFSGASAATRGQGYFNVRAQVNVRQRFWGIVAGYNYGPTNIFQQSALVYGNNFSRSIQIRPYFNKFIYRDKVHLSSYSSYTVNTGSNVENLSLNAQLNFHTGNGWILRAVNNLFVYTFSDDEGGSSSNRTYTMHLGFTKRFDWDQPRVRYHDLRILFFNDLNGNRVLDENEYLIDNVLTNISRVLSDSTADQQLGSFIQKELVSNTYGEIVYENIPDGVYKMDMLPLFNLKDLYNVNGPIQQVAVFDDVTFYVPFSQSYKVVGHVDIDRDEFSSTGLVSVADIRVTVSDPEGRQFTTLTDPDGNFVVYVPQNPGYHTVTVANVLGDKFFLEQDVFTINFNGYKVFEVNFKFLEKKRKIKFNNGGAENFFRNGPANPTINEGDNNGGIPQPERPNVPAGGPAGGATGNTGNSGNQGGAFNGAGGGNNQGSVNQGGNNAGGNPNNGTSAAGNPAGAGPGGAPAPSILPPNDDFARNLFKTVNIEPTLAGDELRKELNQKLTPNAPDNETRPINKGRIGYRVVIGVFTEQMPTELLSNLVGLGYKNEGILRDDGSTQFISSSFPDEGDAENYLQELQNQGYSSSEIVGDYNGVTITREQATALKNQ